MPPDPWAPEEDLWEPPPLRYPKGQPDSSPQRPRNPARAKRTPQTAPQTPSPGSRTSPAEQAKAQAAGEGVATRSGAEGNEDGEGDEASKVVERLVGFTRDRGAKPSHEGELLPGEEGGELLQLLRTCQSAAWGAGTLFL